MRNGRVVLNALILVLCCSISGWSQDTAKPTTKGATAEKKSTNRLPANYGKLGLTDAQKDKVYVINDKYEAQLDGLEEQIKALKAKRGAEVEAVLTAEQKKILKDVMDDSKEKATKAKAKPGDKDAPDAKPKK